jgi:hypothetical protein
MEDAFFGVGQTTELLDKKSILYDCVMPKMGLKWRESALKWRESALKWHQSALIQMPLCRTERTTKTLYNCG